MSAPMVRALLDGTKTQTRRVVKPQPTHFNPAGVPRRASALYSPSDVIHCPYGQPGDRLWVRESHVAWGCWETRFSTKKGRDEWRFIDMTVECGRQYGYVADGDWPWPMAGKRRIAGATPTWWTRPSIFMPRAASRITLEITDVRVQRLQEISVRDAIAEGIAAGGPENPDGIEVRGYRSLWESINGTGSWDPNPWVWAISFRRLNG